MYKRIQQNGLWGFCDESGSIVIPCEWEDARIFRDGVAMVKRDGCWGLIDTSGNLVSDCQWDAIEFSWLSHYQVLKGSTWYLLDKYGRLCLGNNVYGIQRNDKWGLADSSGQLLTPCYWDLITPFSSQWDLAAVKQGNKWGLIHADGTLASACQGDYIGDFKNKNPFRVGRDGKYGYMDETGNLVIPCIWDALKDISCDLLPAKQDGKWGYLDDSGQLVIPCIWEEAEDFQDYLDEEYAGVRRNGKWGLIDKTGNLVIPCAWYGVGHHFDSWRMVVYEDPDHCYAYDMDSQRILRKEDDSFDSWDRPVVRYYGWG